MTRRAHFPAMSPGRWLAVGAVVLLIALLPLATSSQYIISVSITALILLVLNTSWNFVLGVAGVWNFGQLAIYALGGYGAGLIMLHTPVPAWLAVLGGGVAAGLFSIVLAFPTLRLYGIYTSLLTFSFAQVIQLVIVNDNTGITGSTYGFPSVSGLYPNLSPLAQNRAYYWTVLAVVVACTVAVALISRSKLGIALRTIRDAPSYAAARGVSPLRYRIYAFAISGFMAGVAGGLYMSYYQSMTPSVMGLTPMSVDVTMLVIGGLGTIFGPVLGTSLLTIIQTLLVDYPGIELTILGAVLLVIVVFVPGGLVGLIARARGRLTAWVSEDDGAGPPAAAEADARAMA